jgi:peptidoglycan/xylan/chitin deacetylase (PgdA/CDA1 family)
MGVPTPVLGALSGLPPRRRLVIFTYHRVLPAPDPVLPNEPTATFFEQQLQWISGALNVLPLPEAAELLAAGRLPPRAACITFDDGYRNNHDVALPLLKRYRLPATFFVATGALEMGAMWNDLIIESVRRCGSRFDLRKFDLGDHPIARETERAAIVDRTLDAMKYMAVDARFERAREIYEMCCGNELPSLMMTPEMLRSLVKQGHDVGAHTVTHPILTKVDDRRATDEIRKSRDWLTHATGQSPTSFAYPNGRPGVDFDARHCDMVQGAGFTCAVSTAWGCAVRSSNRMALPRFTPWERTRDGFVMRLAKTYVRSYLPSHSDA